MKSNLRERVINLRKEGLSYSEILKKIPVAKSTLSLWLRSVGLSKKQEQRLTERKLASMARGAKRKREIRLERSLEIEKSAKNEVKKLIHDPLWLTGTILYWGEGSKEKPWKSARVSLSNMDVDAHRLFLIWLKKFTGITSNNLSYELFIHEKSDINKAKKFWKKNLALSKNQIRIYLKRHNPATKRKNTGESYNGVFKINVAKSIDLNRRIAGWIKGVIEYLK